MCPCFNYLSIIVEILTPILSRVAGESFLIFTRYAISTSLFPLIRQHFNLAFMSEHVHLLALCSSKLTRVVNFSFSHRVFRFYLLVGVFILPALICCRRSFCFRDTSSTLTSSFSHSDESVPWLNTNVNLVTKCFSSDFYGIVSVRMP